MRPIYQVSSDYAESTVKISFFRFKHVAVLKPNRKIPFEKLAKLLYDYIYIHIYNMTLYYTRPDNGGFILNTPPPTFSSP